MSIKTPRQYASLIWKYMREHHKIEPDYCKRNTREASGILVSKSRTAKEAAAETKHRFTGYWVPGAFVWFENDGDWHVGRCAFRKGYVFSTDTPIWGEWNRPKLVDIPFGKFVFFSRDMDGITCVKVPTIKRKYIP